MMGRKSPDDMAKMMGEMMPQMMEKMGPEEIERIMIDMMPHMMDICFSEMDGGRRQFMLAHCRGILDQMENEYPATGSD